jgi:transposase InsO family protein
MVTPAAKRDAVAHLPSAFDMSERRACTVIGCVRMTVRYHSRGPDDAGLRQRLRALLRREGFLVNHKRLFRIYRDERLMVRRRGGRKRALGTRAPMLVPQWPNDRWSLDFVADQFIDGRRMRILVVVDDCTRECLTLVADTSISGLRVARKLDRLLVARGKPRTIVSDNGTELTSNAILRWADDHKVAWHFIAPGKPGAECLRRVVHGPPPGRVAQRDAVPLAPARARHPRSVAGRLQQRAPTLAARLDEPSHLRRSTAVRYAALRRRLRSADRRHHRPAGYNRTPDSNRNWIKVRGNVNEGQIVEYEEVSNRGKTSAENLKVQRSSLLVRSFSFAIAPWSASREALLLPIRASIRDDPATCAHHSRAESALNDVVRPRSALSTA